MKNRTRSPLLAISLLAASFVPGQVFAQTATITGIETSGDGYKIQAPTIETVDANIDGATIRGLFGEGFADSAQALATLDATAIRIPELAVEYDVPGEDGGVTRARIIYRDIELDNVRDGIAGRASIAVSEIVGDTEDPTTIALGPMSTDQLDIGAVLSFYGLAPGQSLEMRPIYRNFVLEGGTVTGDDANCTIGPASAEWFNARPLQYSFADLMRVTTELEAAEASETEPSRDTLRTLIGFYADFLTAMESSPSVFEGLSCEGREPDGRNFTFSAGPATVGGFEPGVYPAFALDNFTMEADDGWFRLDNFTWKSMDVEDVLENLAARDGDIDEAWLSANWRFLIPQFEGFSMSGLAMDVPGENGNRVAAGIASLEVTLDDYVNGIPATVVSNASGVEFAVPEGADGAPLRAFGIEQVSMGYGFSARWDREARVIEIEDLTLSGRNLGRVSISGRLGNAGPELFSESNEVMMAAALALTATELTIDLENAGGLSLLIAASAAEQNQQPQSMQIVAAGMAQALPLAVLGGTPEATALSAALGAFMGGTPNLTITLTSVDPAGLGVAELMAASENPMLLQGKMTIVSEASGDPIPFVWPELPADGGQAAGDADAS